MARPRPAARPATEGEVPPPTAGVKPSEVERAEVERAEVERRLREHQSTPLAECGEAPDPRFTFANERTFLAWSRTALALIAAGLAAAQLLHFGYGGVRLIIALPLIALGGAAAVTSYRQWEGNERRLRLRLPLSYSPVGKLVALGISIIGVAAGILVIVDLITR